jgi:hypothetical protein
MVTAMIIATILIWQRRDLIFGSVFVWALVAIAIRQKELPTLAIIAGLLSGILVLMIIIRQKFKPIHLT